MILSIDTSDRALGVDISEGGHSVARRILDLPRIHARELIPTVVELLQETNADVNALQAVAVAKGPGSYTGLRIGVSSAKGLAYGLGVPIIGVPTMNALARTYRDLATEPEPNLVTTLTSRRNELYVQGWQIARSIRPRTDVRAIAFESVPDFIAGMDRGKVAVMGSGADAFTSAATEEEFTLVAAPASVASEAVHGVAGLAFDRLSEGMFDDVSTFEPFYLKDFVAKRGTDPIAVARNR